MISTSGITMQFGDKPLFENISVKFGDGNRYGLIGANGCGKSTLMKILGGDLEPTAGNVIIDQHERLGKLRQDHFAFEEFTVLDTVMMGHEELWKIKQERDHLYSQSELSEEDGMRAGDLESHFADLDGYSAEPNAGDLLISMGIPVENHYNLMKSIAPGWKLRVLLAQALFGDPEIILLDEPTNNLDINAIRWLEGVINARNSTMIIISHDRHFLNSVCTHMADLDYGELRIYPGNYDEYMTAASQVQQKLLSDNAKKTAQIQELQAFVSRFSANASKSSQATSRAKQIEKIKLDEVKPSSRVNPFMRFVQDKKLYRNALELKGLSKGFDDKPLFENFNLMVPVGERVAVIGPNGIGKTTLLRCLAGDLEPTSGEIKWSENVKMGYYAQDHSADFSEEISLFDWMAQWKKKEHGEQEVRGNLGRMLFSQNEIKKSVKALSGGEKGRMLFGKFMFLNPNVLLLDEPTNHMDMEFIESLNTALENYPGTLIFVSHDRELIASIATRIIELTPDGIVDYHGSYEEYLRSQGIE
ncbi:ATPase components of ABC transporters with duplicated ATPase domains [Mariprofundus ferrinatatus]|uniref:Probable ATP-binding protein YbiT n=1 Tax=Mariprofundus ferrinatatus TaxID=1921087 RepID=A0A2K8L3Y3_9PROT|nr:ABC-F family ATPase [Mariprofundus ferrinatatus]ATX82038.1 ATPase components of ABC transporters with duplicated ATPase domains [Mariprofundus ferrinatatus]